MGRLSLVGIAWPVLLAACDSEEAPSVPKSRAAAIAATTKPGPAALPSAEPARQEQTAPKRSLCAGQLDGKGFDPPSAPLSTAGTPPPADELPVGGGAWTWVNFWAAWCVPCKEEIPRLRSWEKKLAAGDPSLRLVFVSLDDDERQLQRFLEGQPAGGLKTTYWLKDGKQREEWMAEATLETDPELPAHLLIDPQGKVRCKVQGAVEDRDFERVQEIVKG